MTELLKFVFCWTVSHEGRIHLTIIASLSSLLWLDFVPVSLGWSEFRQACTLPAQICGMVHAKFCRSGCLLEVSFCSCLTSLCITYISRVDITSIALYVIKMCGEDRSIYFSKTCYFVLLQTRWVDSDRLLQLVIKFSRINLYLIFKPTLKGHTYLCAFFFTKFSYFRFCVQYGRLRVLRL